MWFEADEIVELFRGYLPYYLIIALPLFIIISPAGAAHEFPVYRMQQFDLHGVHHGCRSSPVNLEARSLSGWSTSRHCVVARLEDITADIFREICTRAGALLIILPQHISSLQDEERQLDPKWRFDAMRQLSLGFDEPPPGRDQMKSINAPLGVDQGDRELLRV